MRANERGRKLYDTLKDLWHPIMLKGVHAASNRYRVLLCQKIQDHVSRSQLKPKLERVDTWGFRS